MEVKKEIKLTLINAANEKNIGVKINYKLLKHLPYFNDKNENESLCYDLKITKDEINTYFGTWLQSIYKYSKVPLFYHPIMDYLIVTESHAEQEYENFVQSYNNLSEDVQKELGSFNGSLNVYNETYGAFMEQLEYSKVDSKLNPNLNCEYWNIYKLWIKPENTDFIPIDKSGMINVKAEINLNFSTYAQVYYLPKYDEGCASLVGGEATNDIFILTTLGDWIRGQNVNSTDRLQVEFDKLEITWPIVKLATTFEDETFFKYWKLPGPNTVEDITLLSKDHLKAYEKIYFEQIKYSENEFNGRIKKYCSVSPVLAEYFWNNIGKVKVLSTFDLSIRATNKLKHITTFESFKTYTDSLADKRVYSVELQKLKKDFKFINGHIGKQKSKQFYVTVSKYAKEFSIEIDDNESERKEEIKTVIQKLGQKIKLIKQKEDTAYNKKN